MARNGKNESNSSKLKFTQGIVDHNECSDMNRFAGSSEEEDNEVRDDCAVASGDQGKNDSDNDVNIEMELITNPKRNNLMTARGAKVKANNSSFDGDYNDDSSVDEYAIASLQGNMKGDDFPYGERASSGMANAMARILGDDTDAKNASSNKNETQNVSQSVILSKTTTPLQRMQRLEKQTHQEQRQKRKANRELNLTALHIPLSVATTNTSSRGTGNCVGLSSVAREFDQERLHRRVATRGVVALFNAISQHQKKTVHPNNNKTGAAPLPTAANNVQQLTKHGFLDMIKTTANTFTNKKKDDTKSGPCVNSREQQQQQKNVKPNWNALHDNFMMSSKLKDWDKDDSVSDSDDNGSSAVKASGNDARREMTNRRATNAVVKKKRRFGSH